LNNEYGNPEKDSFTHPACHNMDKHLRVCPKHVYTTPLLDRTLQYFGDDVSRAAGQWSGLGNLVSVLCDRYIYFQQEIHPGSNHFIILVCGLCIDVVGHWKYGSIAIWNIILCSSPECVGSFRGELYHI
jgi:hypothetical protein